MARHGPLGTSPQATVAAAVGQPCTLHYNGQPIIRTSSEKQRAKNYVPSGEIAEHASSPCNARMYMTAWSTWIGCNGRMLVAGAALKASLGEAIS